MRRLGSTPRQRIKCCDHNFCSASIPGRLEKRKPMPLLSKFNREAVKLGPTGVAKAILNLEMTQRSGSIVG